MAVKYRTVVVEIGEEIQDADIVGRLKSAGLRPIASGTVHAPGLDTLYLSRSLDATGYATHRVTPGGGAGGDQALIDEADAEVSRITKEHENREKTNAANKAFSSATSSAK